MDERNPVQVSVIIPALNEEKTVGEVVQGCKPFADQVIIVDGRSQDRTSEIARSAGAEVIIDEALQTRRTRETRLAQVRLALGIFDLTGELGQ